MESLFFILSSTNIVLSVLPQRQAFQLINRGALSGGRKLIIVADSLKSSLKGKIVLGSTATISANKVVSITEVVRTRKQIDRPLLVRTQDAYNLLQSRVNDRVWVNDYLATRSRPANIDPTSRNYQTDNLERTAEASIISGYATRNWINHMTRGVEQVALREVGANWTDTYREAYLNSYFILTGFDATGRSYVKVWYGVMMTRQDYREAWLNFRQTNGSAVYIDHATALGVPQTINGSPDTALATASFNANWDGERIAG